MKKIILISLISFAFIGCKKDSCYVCTFGVVNGYQKAPVEVCGGYPSKFVDSLNNPLPYFCNKK